MGIGSWVKGFGKNTLYYPGCLTKGVLCKEFENYKKIFNKLGIDYILLSKDEVCCGLPVLNAGHKKEVRRLARKNFETFKKYSIGKIITNCPSCYHTFSEIYPELIKEWDIEVEHVTVSILNALKKRGIRFKGRDEDREIVSYHDPCHLGRYSGIYDEPREVIELLGGRVVEMKKNKKNAMCCGGGGGLRANFPSVAKEIAKKRVKDLDENAKSLISPCGLCYLNLKSASGKSEEFSTFVLNKLGEMGR